MNNFKIYENAYSIYRNTIEAIPNLLNFNFSNENLTKNFLVKILLIVTQNGISKKINFLIKIALF